MTATVTGYDEAIEVLRQIDVAVRARIVRRAVKDVVSEAAREMKSAAPQRADAGKRARQRLRQRLGDMVKTYRDGSLTFAMAGERSYARGQRHAHLVEHGHRIVTGGTVEHRRAVTNKLTGEIGYRTYIPRAVKAERRGKGQVKGRTTQIGRAHV